MRGRIVAMYGTEGPGHERTLRYARVVRVWHSRYVTTSLDLSSIGIEEKHPVESTGVQHNGCIVYRSKTTRELIYAQPKERKP